MSRGWWARFALLVFFTVLSVVYVYPTLANLDLQKTNFPFKQKINLGLDLQGGLYMVMGADFEKVYQDIVQRQASSFEQTLKEKGITVSRIQTVREPADDPRIKVEYDASKQNAVYDLIKEQYWTLRIVEEAQGSYTLGLSRDFRAEVKDRTINQSIEVIRNRIDEFGVAEPSIVSQGEDRIVIELPGVRDIERAKDLIGRTAKLEFHIVADKVMDPGQVAQLVSEIEQQNSFTYQEGQKFSEYVQRLNKLAEGKIPADTVISFERVTAPGQTEAGVGRVPYLLYSDTEVTGEDLQDAQVSFDENNRPVVAFELNPRGASTFSRLTGEHIGERLAIVLDNIVHSAPVIQSQIGARGQISMGSGNRDAMMQEAKDLAIVLRAGALPAQLEFLEQRVVGPSLGQDSIEKGAFAALIGSIAVFLFITVYYRLSGLIATISLVLNVLFVLAILVGLEATLTLPGIAGIALTVGIAVDSNVVIYERIREELRAGKRVHGAIEAGFQKAFRTILDANVTSAAAGVILLIYGTGPIKGFAVTLLIGIVTTMFTAIFVCKLFFDAYLRRLENKGSQALSI